jgi:hypothetical protein
LISTCTSTASCIGVPSAAAAATSNNEVLNLKRAADEAEHLPDRRSPHRAAHPSEIAAHVSLLR